MIARIGRINRNDRQMGKVFAGLTVKRKIGRFLSCIQRLLRESVRDTMLGDGNQAEAFRGERIAHHFYNFDAGTVRASGALGNHQLAFFSPAKVGNRRRIAHAFVNRGKPCFSGAVNLDNAHQAFAARGQLFHNMRDPTAVALFSARQNPVAGFESWKCAPLIFGTLAALAFAHSQSGRFVRSFIRPIVWDSNRFPILDLNNAQHSHFGNAAHAVIGGFPAVDQAFLGHVLEQLLQSDFLLTFKAKSFRDLSLAGWPIAGLDKFEHLPARRHTLRFAFWLFRQVSTPAQSGYARRLVRL